ncbi:hypothetical protein HYH03_008324 [Edaphochlamys debaryana]|uniref:Uncharacterized protein n=1 Tax=Edaphochlamys debaryana TaxID=47281 RepID=A0A835Y2J8_9CHLO|nr:hypothetical protein HYH03_008324 [Edaphochlamys debaryana]|eukprot:KAG2493508.1 hypothetical protein HYH03_008324 [Edaphochlamys debaryana]
MSTTTAALPDASLLTRFGIGDAHCHPQDDPHDAGRRVRDLRTPCLAVMGTRAGDWGAVEELAKAAPGKVIPCFGVHPWFAHLHALSDTQLSDPAALLDSPPNGKDAPVNHPQLLAAMSGSRSRSSGSSSSGSGSGGTSPRVQPPPAGTPAGGDGAPGPGPGPGGAGVGGSGDEGCGCGPSTSAGARGRVRAPGEWLGELRRLLGEHPGALVGEFGLDRAAVVPGTRLKPSFAHQLALTEAHLALAAELGRPVSMHCVQSYGHLQDLLRRLGPSGCPPKIMLHSYGGSVDLVKGFTRLPGGVGDRIYFSFSSVINARPDRRAGLLQRLAAVPPERLLLESDQSSADRVDEGMRAILADAAEARGMAVEALAAAVGDNFRAFFASSLEAMAKQAQRQQQQV